MAAVGFGAAAVFAACLLAGVEGALWASGPQEGQVVYACQGQTVTIPWQYLLVQGQDIKDIMWYYRGHSDELVAIYTHGHFQVMPAFASRVSLAMNAGLSISDVRVSDSGNYSVEITLTEHDGTLTNLWKNVVLSVSNSLMTTDGNLHVTMSPNPVLDSTKNQFAIVLNCGHFTYMGTPPYGVTWTLPDSTTTRSTGYQNGAYQLHLYGPVQAGSYTCTIPAVESNKSCVNHAVSGSVAVDGMEVRLALLEANQQALRQENAQLVNQLKQLQVSSHGGISFMSRLSSNVNMTKGYQRLLFDVVDSNMGGAYDSTGALFTAPFGGTYFFAISTRCSDGIGDAEIVVSNPTSLPVDHRTLCRVDSNVANDMGSCQGIAHMATGETAWVQSFESIPQATCYRANDTVFTGFLVNGDP